MMLSEKIRSLHCGMQAGLNLKDLNGEPVIFIHETPYELEDIICRWISMQTQENQVSMLRSDALHRPALTESGWCDFVTWMTSTLRVAQPLGASKGQLAR